MRNTWAMLRGIVRRHALLLIDGDLQRESSVVNVVARDVRPLRGRAARRGEPLAFGSRSAALDREDGWLIFVG